MKILPDLTIHELTTHDAGLLILPGGDTWHEPLHTPLFAKVHEFLITTMPPFHRRKRVAG
jgi:hypothetical protein